MNYELLEKMKYGRIEAFKFDSKESKFNTPNIVVVFSNKAPGMDNLSKDTWEIFKNRDNDFIDVTGNLVCKYK